VTVVVIYFENWPPKLDMRLLTDDLDSDILHVL